MTGRIALLTGCLLFAMLGALAEDVAGARAYAVQAAGVAALVDDSGKTILDDAEDLFTVRPGRLYAVGHTGNYRLCDAQGNLPGATRFDMIDDCGSVLTFRQGKRYGAMDERGEVIIPAEWAQLVFNGENGFLALDDDDRLYYLSMAGSAVLLEASVSGTLSSFGDGRMVFCDETGRYGCLDGAGNVAIPASFDRICGFEDGVSIAAAGGMFGFIDTFGTWIVEPRYTWMQRGEGFIAALTGGGSLRAFAIDGELLFEVFARATQAAVMGEYAILWDSDAARLYNAKGRCIYEASPDTLFFPGVDGQVIASEGRWDAPSQWLVNPSGIAEEGRYQRVAPLISEHYAFLTMQGVEYYSEILNSLQISWNYDSARWGLMDGNGAALLPAEYLEIRALGEDRLLLRTEDAVIFADRDGRRLRSWIVTPTRTTSGTGG